jgi:hypothetical protein
LHSVYLFIESFRPDFSILDETLCRHLCTIESLPMPDRRPKPDRPTPPKEKLCKTCRRPLPFTPQKSRDWDIAKYCSDACSGYRPGAVDTALEAAILELLAERGPGKTICPSEAAKQVGGSVRGKGEKTTRQAWESLMEPARAAARRLAATGQILVTQHNHPVDPTTAKGPIRLSLPVVR